MIITGTDTDIGKSVVASMLTLALGAKYFKPIQCGTDPETDVDAVRRMTKLGPDRILPSPVVLKAPLSPHRAAELEGVDIDLGQLTPPNESPLIIEGAGGLMVPVNRQTLFIDVFKSWNQPIILVTRTGLGTLNHTLLSLEALRARDMDVLGVLFVGDENADNMRTIGEISGQKVLGRLPLLAKLDVKNLKQAFDRNFNAQDFEIIK
ncbi:MAG: dethiobiotin synthase [Rhodospirillaceae bacterium]|nr:MAG: dethiobiotin synthase [Rhodospirillaceae bacterium]